MTKSERWFFAVVTLLGLVWIILERDVKRAGLVFAGVSWLSSGVFVVMYYMRSNWKATPVGRAVFWKIASTFTLLTWIFVNWMFGDAIPFRDAFRKIFYLFFMVALLRLNVVLWRIQRTARESHSKNAQEIS
jgi:hypothetical protein